MIHAANTGKSILAWLIFIVRGQGEAAGVLCKKKAVTIAHFADSNAERCVKLKVRKHK